MHVLLILSFLGLCLAAGAAIAYVIGAVAVLGFIASDYGEFLAIIPQRILSQLDVFVLLTLPLFILAGDLMNRGGVTRTLVTLALALVGRFKGGLGYVNILASVFFSGVSGSAAADAVAMSRMLVPAMRQRGYSAEYAAALTAASSLVGPIIPPSVILIFYGALMGVSVPALFAAGVVPGLLLAIALMGMHGIFVRRGPQFAGTDSEVPDLMPAFLSAVPALFLPVIILGGVLFGIVTPAESAAIAVVTALAIGVFQRELVWRDVVMAGERTAVMLGAIFMILCAIAVFSYLAALNQWPQKLAQAATALGLGPLGYLLVVNLCFLIAGMIMDVKAAVALLAPVLVPVALSMGIDPVHLGIVICFNITLGLLTPPFGGVLFLVTTVTGVPYWALARAVLPFLLAQVFLLVLLTLVPEITLWLPNLLGML